MDEIGKHLDIVFRRIQPERLLQSLRRSQPKQEHYALWASSTDISSACYVHYAFPLLRQYSTDEIENFYLDMLHLMTDDFGRKSVYNLLQHYAKRVLRLYDNQIVCRAEEILSWREVSFLLGQDLFTTAFLAFSDVQNGRISSTFSWPAAIGTDDRRLKAIMNKGISENHFHLYGSTQVFSLSWMCLMNHPRLIAKYSYDRVIQRRMNENLQETVNLSQDDVHLSWIERLNKAAGLRSYLFECIHNSAYENEPFDLFAPQMSVADYAKISSRIDRLRFQYGAKYRQPDGADICLDYAIEENGSNTTGVFRSLSGERALMYHCFYRFFRGESSTYEQDAFYLYLLIKAQLRSELIQLNGRVGFRNFAAYQDRKGDFWDRLREYDAEALRMAVIGSLESGAMRSLEMRIGPQATAAANLESIQKYDSLSKWADDTKCLDAVPDPTGKEKFFYVIHFIKQRDDLSQSERFGVYTPRNAKVRKQVRKQAKAIEAALARSLNFCNRIRGIDAANVEIGCRPETFATEFRFLRDFVPAHTKQRKWEQAVVSPHLHATYHAGEDFLDIVDGLRAIDEPIRFLDLKRGDRIGHALALGVSPMRHYAYKEHRIILPKQVRLDDLVWILFRGNELGFSLDNHHQWIIQEEAERLFAEIYGDWLDRQTHSYTLAEYYQMWQLRGDAPDRYSYTGLRKQRYLHSDPMDKYFLQENPNLTHYRERTSTATLYYNYHYDPIIKKNGAQVVKVAIDDWYQNMVQELQQKMQQNISSMGIGIECNPSSNYLIGTFGGYDQHPIFTFNRAYLDADNGLSSNSPQLSVSVNTDDQGVFDTSLENEYALLAGALRLCNEQGRRKYTEDQINLYLDHIRELGNLQTF